MPRSICTYFLSGGFARAVYAGPGVRAVVRTGIKLSNFWQAGGQLPGQARQEGWPVEHLGTTRYYTPPTVGSGPRNEGAGHD